MMFCVLMSIATILSMSDVNLIHAFPPIGRDLPVCALDADQCCHRGFIRHIIQNVKYELAEFLRHEYNVTVLGFLETMNDAFECKWLLIIERVTCVATFSSLMFMKFEWGYKI